MLALHFRDGGGDELLLYDLFGDSPRNDPLGRAAGPIDGVMSIMTGIAANRSFESGLPVNIADLVRINASAARHGGSSA